MGLRTRIVLQQRAVDDGEHAVPDMPVLCPANFGSQLHRPAAVVGDLEEADRYPDRENVAAHGEVVEDLGKQLVLQVGMRWADGDLQEPRAWISGSGSQHRVVDTASREL